MLLLIAPKLLENVPASHEAQDEALDPSTYVPAGHNIHVLMDEDPITELYFPASHFVHSDMFVAPVPVKNVPMSHLVQFVNEESNELNVPDEHALQSLSD